MMIVVAHMIATTIADPPTDVERIITCCWVIDGDAEASGWLVTTTIATNIPV